MKRRDRDAHLADVLAFQCAHAVPEGRPCAMFSGRTGEFCWDGYRVFCNPPYSQIAKWAKHFSEQAVNANLIVALVPARPDTAWWNDYIKTADLIHFIRGRLRFGDSKNSAPFPSALAFWLGLERICRRPICP